MWQVRYVAGCLSHLHVLSPRHKFIKKTLSFFFRKELQEGIEGKLKLKLDVGVLIAPLFGACALFSLSVCV